MNIKLFLMALTIIVGIIVVIIIIYKKLKKIPIRIVFAAIIMFFVTFGLYLLNPVFRQEIDMRFNTENQHRVILNNQSFYLPLPNKTILNYRTSDMQAVYMTRASFNEISDFYSFIADKDSYSKLNKSGKLRLSFKYHGINYVVEVENNIKNRKLTILVV